MIAEFGSFFLIIALLCALLQASYLFAHGSLRGGVATLLPAAAWIQALCVSLSFVTLIILRLDSDFTVANVIAHSNINLPTLYKITGTWGNHEGSMLLWALVVAVFGALLCGMRCDRELRLFATSAQAIIGVGVLLFIIFTSNPFERRFPPTVDGDALNPLLQDIALAIHPPLLYLGYVGFSAVFSLGIAALLQGRMDKEWARIAHPWILAAWSALTLGIGLGSWWAYRVLGWGGFWFWDPVENASLLPWLSGTALLHANIVLRKRGCLPQWVSLLSIITFGLSLLGTFLVRSGVLISVHSFASDPARGLFILAYITVLLGGALTLFAARAGTVSNTSSLLPASREGMIVINNLLLLTACATVLLGTVYPMFSEWLGDGKLTVGPPYFNATFLPLMSIPLFLAGLVPFMPWERASIRTALRKAIPSLLAATTGGILVLAFSNHAAALAAAGIALSLWLATASLQWLVSRKTNRTVWSIFLAHVGAAVLVAGVTGATLWKHESEKWMSVGDTITIGNYELVLKGLHLEETPNHKALVGAFDITSSGESLTPEYRSYTIRGSSTSIAAIQASLGHDLYAVIGESSPDGKRVAVRMYYNPMISFIWAGFVLMALGGLFAILFNQRRPYGS